MKKETRFTDNYDKVFLSQTMKGPNAMKIAEELTSYLPISPGMRMLELGCPWRKCQTLYRARF